jgi:hypothetical protein
MKAKEYIINFHTFGDKEEAMANLGRTFLSEFMDVKKKRNIKTDDSLFVLIHEFNQKWGIIADALQLNEQGFLNILTRISSPINEGYNQWKRINNK